MSQGQLLDPGPAAPPVSRVREREAYYTPADATQDLIRLAPELRGGELLDPCCGDGRMARALLAAGRVRQVRLNDFSPPTDSPAWAVASRRDAADPALYIPAPDLVVTNPPFGHAGAIAHQALARARRGVALLVRLTWLEACGSSPRAPRGERRWLTACPPTRVIVLGRISFTGAGSDCAGYVWAIWTRGEGGGAWDRGSIDIVGRSSAAQLTLGGPHAEEA